MEQDKLVLFSIDPTYRDKTWGNLSPEQEKGERLHSYLLLGQTEITDPEVKRQTMYALNRAIRFAPDQGFRCFNPRHVLRMTKGEKTVDVVICFECCLYDILVGEQRSGKLRTIDSLAQPALDKLLTDAGVKLAPKTGEE